MAPDPFAGAPPPAPPLFRTARASDAVLLGLKSDGPPPRNVWDTGRIAASQSGSNLFRLKTASLPALEVHKRGGKKHSGVSLVTQSDEGNEGSKAGDPGTNASSEKGAVAKGPVSDMELDGKHAPRGKKYLDLLMKHHDKRLEADRKVVEVVERDRRENAARLATRLALRAEAKKAREDESDTESSSEEDIGEPGEFGELTAYEGSMKLDLEVVVMGAPRIRGERRRSRRRSSGTRQIILPNGDVSYEVVPPHSPGGSSIGDSESSSRLSSLTAASSCPSSSSSRRKSSKSSEKSGPRIDIAAELEALQEELGVEEESGSGSDGLPDDLLGRQNDNVWDNPSMRWQLGIGGTVFFIPDAERYGHAPSLPPPPPTSLTGRKRVHMKPRLPLDISNHRYRDEHPNIFPPDPWNPTRTDRKTFERKLMTLDFYASCNRALAKLPPLERRRDRLKNEVAFGRLVERDTRYSFVWKAYLEKERRRRQKEADRRAREQARAEAAAAEAGEEVLPEHAEPLGNSPSAGPPGTLGRPSNSNNGPGHPL